MIINHSLTLSKKKFNSKNMPFFKNQWKVAIYTGCQNKFIVQQPTHFLPFLKAPPVKLRPHSQISFKSWFYNVGLELRFFFQNQCYGSLKKLVFRLLKLLIILEQSWLSDIDSIFTIFKGPGRKPYGTFSNQF